MATIQYFSKVLSHATQPHQNETIPSEKLCSSKAAFSLFIFSSSALVGIGKSFPQCLHTTASDLTNSAQYGHLLLSPDLIRLFSTPLLFSPTRRIVRIAHTGEVNSENTAHPIPSLPRLLAKTPINILSQTHRKKITIPSNGSHSLANYHTPLRRKFRSVLRFIPQ